MRIKKGVSIPAFERGYGIVKNKGFVIVAMSIGNSYFSKEKITKLLPFVSNIFSKVRILVADTPSIHTYIAIGYDDKTAKKKTRLAGNRLKNHSHRTIQKTKETNPKADIDFVECDFVEWNKQVAKNKFFLEELKDVTNLYERHKEFKKHVHHEIKKRHEEGLSSFRRDARETTRTVLKGKLKPGIDMEKAIDKGVRYLLEELAFLLASPKIFGIKRVAYIYHRDWPIYVNLIDGNYDDKVRENLAFVKIVD